MRYSLLALFLLLGTASSARAQESSRPSDALILARVCVHEAGFDSTEDCSAIADVLRRLADRLDTTFWRAALAYSGRVLRGDTRRAWASVLDETGTRPRGWGALDWDGDYRGRWLELLAYCERVMRGEEASDCDEPPDDWGGSVDRARAERLGLIEIHCGETRNDFYRRPGARVIDAEEDRD